MGEGVKKKKKKKGEGRRRRRRIVLQPVLTSHLYTLSWMVSPVASLPPET